MQLSTRLQEPGSFDGENGQRHLQLLHGFDDSFARRWVLVGFFPELVQDSVRLGNVLDRIAVLPVLFWCRFVRQATPPFGKST